MIVFEQGHLSRTIFASVNYLSSALVKENLSYFSLTLPSVYSRQVFLDKWICQGKLASVNEALSSVLAIIYQRPTLRSTENPAC